MAHLLNAENATVVLAARTVLDAVSLGLDDGDRVGVVGRNGDGKTTLLRSLMKRQELDGGRVTHSRGLRVGYLDQADLQPDGTVLENVLGPQRLASGTHTWAGDPAVRAVLTGLLSDIEVAVPGGYDAPVSELSGGQRRRVALAAVLLGEHDLLVLDEPTNHLDVEGVDWLATHLRTRWPAGRGALLVVTHDRWFLDAVCTATWEVHDGVVDAYEGGYAAYVLARAERQRVATVTNERRENLLRKELAWLRRGPPARTSKPKFRMDAAAALVADEPPPRDSVELLATASARLGKDVVDLEGVTFAVGTGDARRTLLTDVTWRLAPGDRVGVVGVNGSGKTTVLRLLAGQVVPDGGRVRRGSTVRMGVLTQHLRELDEIGHQRVVEAVQRDQGSVQVGGKEVSATQLVERLGFTGERAWTPVADLSGGERRRLALVRLLVHEPNVLLLDEPTNDLDTDTLAALEDVLDGWAGTLVVVSHDRYLLERVCDRQVAMLGDGRIRDLPGGVEEYLALRAAGAVPDAGTREGCGPTCGSGTADLDGRAEPRGPQGAGAPGARDREGVHARSPHPRRDGRCRNRSRAGPRPRPGAARAPGREGVARGGVARDRRSRGEPMTIRSTTDPASRPIPPGAAVRPGVVALVTAIVVNIVIVVISRATGARLVVTQGGAETEIGVPAVMALTVGSLVVGTVVLALAGRWGAHAWNLLAWAGLGIGVISAALPLLSDADTSTRLTLAMMHVVVGFAWQLAVRRALPADVRAPPSRRAVSRLVSRRTARPAGAACPPARRARRRRAGPAAGARAARGRRRRSRPARARRR